MRPNTDQRADERSTIPEQESALIENTNEQTPHSQYTPDPVEKAATARMP